MPKELVKNTFIYSFVAVINQGLMFLFWLIAAYWLDPAQIGIFSLVMFIVDLFSTIAIFGLDSGVTRFYYTEEDIPAVFTNSLIILLVSVMLSCLVFAVVASKLYLLINTLGPVISRFFLLIILIYATNTATNFIFVHFSAEKKAKLYGQFQLLKTLAFFFLAMALIAVKPEIGSILNAFLLSSLLVIVAFGWKEGRGLFRTRLISRELQGKLLSYCYPLMIYSFVGIVASYFGRIMLDRYTNLVALGIYNFFLMLTLQVNGVWGCFNRAWTPEIFSKLKTDRDNTYDRITYMSFFLTFVYVTVLAVVILLGGTVFRYIFKPVYLQNIGLFYLLLIGPLFSGIGIVGYPLFYFENKTRKILALTSIISGLSLILTMLMVKYFGLNGAALSFIVIQALSSLIYFIGFKKDMHVPAAMMEWLLVVTGCSGVMVVLYLYFSSVYILVAGLSIIALLAYKMGNLARKKQIIYDLLATIRNKIYSRADV
jgi:O-antigen/teichoic acid export membrane protein